MERNIVEILVILMQQFPEGAIKSDEFEPLTEDLIELGYSPLEIETAFFWFYNRIAEKQNPTAFNEVDSGSFRLLHDVEKSILSPDAYGYLIQLRQLEIISLEKMDSIIERSIIIGGKSVSLDDIKSFAAAAIFEEESGFSFPGKAMYIKLPNEIIQ